MCALAAGGGGAEIHQNFHSGLFWVVSLQLMFSESKRFKKVQNHLEPLAWHLALGESVPMDLGHKYHSGSRGLEKVRVLPPLARP